MGVPRERERAFWRGVRDGLSTVVACRRAGVSAGTGQRWFRECGGVPPLSLAAPQGRYLSLSEREEIAVGLAEGLSLRTVAARLRRSPGTISREVRRNRAGRRPYRAVAAQLLAEGRARRPKRRKLEHEPLRAEVQARLERRLSPQQIAASLDRDFAHDEAMQASHETIYRALYVQGRGELGRELARHLRTGRAI